eukprot:CAMPEP_0182426018 /NCGR_PEP_ID=MMETSP1167-20130531/12496_1 /TAXON_ID=2988 /ORGANISM="Mallomonas Sp, Strain CCMP3275" /LENGTH=310 /DNA_ID=CAMNT_0024607157 /DNA_START=586 /DNA_END=1518 /DNA_ORIENTATION=+
MNSFMDAEITGLILETADEFRDKSIRLGAAMIISQQQVAHKWRLSKSSNRLPKKTDQTATVIECHVDELIGFSTALGLPVCVQTQLYESLTVDAVMSRDASTGKLSIRAPYPVTGDTPESVSSSLSSPTTEDAVPVWEILDPEQILSMSQADKRATLRASDVRTLPRPREGEAALDAVLLDLADDAVRREVLRRSRGMPREEERRVENTNRDRDLEQEQEEEEEDEFMRYSALPASAMLGDNKRQVLLREMGEAIDEGDMKRAETLREQFLMYTSLRADPTQPEGSYSPYLDQDDWYMEQRRRSMAPKKK